MKLSEILRLVWINLIQNKFKVVLTSIGIVVGAATIVMVIAIGRGGQWMSQMPGGGMQGGGFGGFMAGENNNNDSSKINQEKITLSEDDMDDLKTFLLGISDITISYTTKSEVDGGDLDEAESYTIAGVKNNYASMSNLTMAAGSFIESSNETNKEKVCILGYSVAKEIFGSVEDAYDSTIYIDNSAYVVNGVISEVGTVSSGISPDDSIFIPYNTGVKYIVGTDVNPTITVIASDVDNVDNVMENIQSVLADNYPNAEFTITDAGSKMEAASESNNTLTTLLIAMAAIVFIVGGIGIMNVLFVSVKERTKEIGILKAIGCTKKDILIEFLLEACFISILGGILGVLLSFGITPIVEYFDVRVELSVVGAVLAVVFAIFTGTVFGFYPALKASKLVPVEALNEE